MSDEKNWQWYYSEDGERFNGPCATRDEAIAEGRREVEGAFHILEATKGQFYFSIDNSTYFEMIDGQNEDQVDPEGNGLSDSLTKEQADDLIQSVNAAIEAWKARTNFNEVPWGFDETRNQEIIQPLAA